jgi:hypothetical protein
MIFQVKRSQNGSTTTTRMLKDLHTCHVAMKELFVSGVLLQVIVVGFTVGCRRTPDSQRTCSVVLHRVQKALYRRNSKKSSQLIRLTVQQL